MKKIRVIGIVLVASIASTSCLSVDGKQADATYPPQLLGIWEGGVHSCVPPGNTDSDARIEITTDRVIDYEQWNEPTGVVQISKAPLAWKVDSLLHIDDADHKQNELFILSGEDEGGLLTIVGRNRAANYIRCKQGQPEAAESEGRDQRESSAKNMHTLELELRRTNSEVLALSRSRFSTYIDDDHAYLDDLAMYLHESDRTWRAYRDADCLLEPFAQGMSRRESYDLTESCRVERTRQRISELSLFFSMMRPNSEETFAGAWSIKWCEDGQPARCGGFHAYLTQMGSHICGTHYGADERANRLDEGGTRSVVGTVIGATAVLAVTSGRNGAIYLVQAKRVGDGLDWRIVDTVREGSNGEPSFIADADLLSASTESRNNDYLRKVAAECRAITPGTQ